MIYLDGKKFRQGEPETCLRKGEAEQKREKSKTSTHNENYDNDADTTRIG